MPMLQQISLSSCFVHIIKVKQLKKTLLQSKQDGISTIIVNYNKKNNFIPMLQQISCFVHIIRVKQFLKTLLQGRYKQEYIIRRECPTAVL